MLAVSEEGPIRGVVFDVDGTLVTLRASIGELYSEALCELGVLLDSQQLERAVIAEWGAFEAEYLNTAELHATQPSREVLVWCELVRRVLRQVDEGLSTRWDLIAGVYSFFARGHSRRLVDGALEACKDLAVEGLVVVAATNNDQRTPGVLAELGLAPHLSHILTAGDLLWKKPSPNFFGQLSQRIGVPAAELLHVGNSHVHDVEAANKAGFQAVLFDPQRRGTEPRITTLAELSGLVRRRA